MSDAPPSNDTHARRLRSLPLLVPAIVLFAIGPLPVPALVAALVVIASTLVRFRLPLDRPTEYVVNLVLCVLVVTGVRAADLGPFFGIGPSTFAVGVALTALSVGALRLWLSDPHGGARADRGLALIAVLASVTGPRRIVAALVTAVALGTTLLVARLLEASRQGGGLAPATRRGKRLLVAAIALAGTIAAVLGVAVGAAYGFLARRLASAIQASYETESGFGAFARLGETSRFRRSERVVMRVRGASVDYLRGATFDTYEGGAWSQSDRSTPAQITAPKAPPAPGDPSLTTIELVRGSRDNLFSPLDSAVVAFAPGKLFESEGGIRHHETEVHEATLWVRPSPPAPHRDGLLAPDARMLSLPRGMLPAVAVQAEEWTRGAIDERDELARITRRLAAFEYVIDPPETRGDPVVDFLFRRHRGSCESFASGMVLLARARGIPARLAMGYRVSEENPVFRHRVVRERNAHAWVEAWLPREGWVTVDPTPAIEIPENLPHEEAGLEELIETAKAGALAVEAWFAELSVFQLGAAAIAGMVVFGWLRWRRRSRVPGRRSVGLGLDYLAKDPAFAKLEKSLEARGLARTLGEPLETWASRVSRAGDGAAARAIATHAAMRYGDLRTTVDLG